MPRWGSVAIVDELGAGVIPIPPDTSQTLLLHADGADASTTVLDSSVNAATMTPAGNAQIDTAQKVFGTASLLFDGAGDYVDTPVHARYDIGALSASSDHTWRMRARWTGLAVREAASIYASLVAWWGMNDNAASSQITDSHSTHHMVLRFNSAIVNTSTRSATANALRDAYINLANTDNTACYVPRSDTALDMADADFSFGGWFKTGLGAAGTAAWIMGRTGIAAGAFYCYLFIEGADNLIKCRYSYDGTNVVTLSSGKLPDGTNWQLIVVTYNKTAGLLELRYRNSSVGVFTKVTAALTGSIFTGASTANFAIGERLNADGTFEAAVNNRTGVTGIDECFYANKAITDGEFAYLFNAGSIAGKTYPMLVADATAMPLDGQRALVSHAAPDSNGAARGGYQVYEYGGRLGLQVHSATSSAFASWRTLQRVVALNAWYALAFVIDNGVPHVYVDGVEQAGSFVDSPSRLDFAMLLHCDGTDGATVLIDSSLNAVTMTASGGAQLDNGILPPLGFGATCLMLASGATDWVTTPVHARYDLGAISAATYATFCCRARAAGATIGLRPIFAHATPDSAGAGRGGFVIYESAGRLGFMVANNASASAYWSKYETTSPVLPATTWVALAFVIRAGVPHIYKDGIEQVAAFAAPTCSLLMHFDGTNGSTSFVDSSANAATFTRVGNSQISTAQSVFGGSSCAFDGAGDAITTPHSAAIDLPTGDFVIELRVRLNSVAASYFIFSKATGAGLYNYNLQFSTSTAHFAFGAFTAAGSLAFQIQNTTTIVANTWYRVTCEREGDTFRIRLNGAVENSTTIASVVLRSNAAEPLAIGGASDGSTSLNGYIDELVIAKGFPVLDSSVPYTTNLGVQGTFIGLDTSRTDYGLRVGGGYLTTSSWVGHLDEIAANLTQALYSANYTPEDRPFINPALVSAQAHR
jgi:hypothetical protein